MKINIVTGKPADGGPARCLMISETADPVLDFYTTLRANEGVLTLPDGKEEKFAQIALFQRPTTSKRSRFHHDVPPAQEKKPEPQTPAVADAGASEETTSAPVGDGQQAPPAAVPPVQTAPETKEAYASRIETAKRPELVTEAGLLQVQVPANITNVDLRLLLVAAKFPPDAASS